MTIIIGPFEHYCTSAYECGEEIARPGASVRLVRKWVWRDLRGKILRMFASETEARKQAAILGYEVSA
jgi:hypothetical protein